LKLFYSLFFKLKKIIKSIGPFIYDHFVKAPISFVSKNIILSIIIALAASFLLFYLKGPGDYVVYVVGDFSKDDKFSHDIYKGLINSCKEPKLTFDKHEIRIEKVNDKGIEEKAIDIAEKIVNRNDAIMIVGHMLSSTTKAAIKTYQERKPPIPMILPTETHPGLYQEDDFRKGFSPVYRLAPSDDDQAEIIAKLIANSGAQNVWIASDEKNKVYSNYLTEQILSQSIFTKMLEIHQTRTVNIVHPMDEELKFREEEDWFTNLKKLKNKNEYIESFIYVGDTDGALFMLKGLREICNPSNCTRILSDFAAKNKLINVDHNIDLNGVLLLHTLPANKIKYTPNDDSTSEDPIGYEIFGHDACVILRALIKDADSQYDALQDWGTSFKRFIWTKKIDSVRASISREMEKRVLKRRPFEDVLLDAAGSYTFDYLGRRERAKFHVWVIQNNDFEIFSKGASETGAIDENDSEKLKPKLINPPSNPNLQDPVIFGKQEIPLEWTIDYRGEIGEIAFILEWARNKEMEGSVTKEVQTNHHPSHMESI